MNSFRIIISTPICYKIFLFFILQLSCCRAEVPDAELYPYLERDGGTQFQYGDDFSQPVNFTNFSFQFLNSVYTKIYINSNGNLSFKEGIRSTSTNCNPGSIPTIMVLWSDLAPHYGGGIYHLYTRDETLLAKAENDLFCVFPRGGQKLQWLFIVTWKRVPHLVNYLTTSTTFQAVLTSDGSRSFVILNYSEINKWPIDITAAAGFISGDNNTVHTIPGSCSNSIPNTILERSNFGYPGKWIFQVDSDFKSPAGHWQTDNLNPITFHPQIVTPMSRGVLSMHIQCLDRFISNNATLTCYFRDGNQLTSVRGMIDPLKKESQLMCEVPHFYTLGEIPVKIIYRDTTNHHNEFSFGIKMHAVKGEGDELDVSLDRLPNGSWSLDVRWNPAVLQITGIETKRVETSIRVLDYNGTKWQDLGPISELSDDTALYGSYTNTFDSLPLSSFNSLKVIAVQQKYNLNLNMSAVKQVVSSYLPALEFSHSFIYDQIKADQKHNGTNEYDTKCKVWLAKDPSDEFDVLPCPTFVELAGVDWKFKEHKVSKIMYSSALKVFIQRIPSRQGSGSLCAYDRNGELMIGSHSGSIIHRSSPNSATNYLKHYSDDILPYMYCCRWSIQNETYCRSFFHRRAAVDMAYSSPKFALMSGKGNFRTFDGSSYQFNGCGEFWGIQYLNGSLKMQIRMKKYPIKNISAITAVAWELTTAIGSVTKLQVSSNMSNDIVIGFPSEDLALSSTSKNLKGFTMYHNACIISVLSSTKIIITFVNGLTFQVSCRCENDGNDGITGISIVSSAEVKWHNKINGLVGKFNGNSEDDLFTGASVKPAGIFENISLTNPSFERLWRISEGQSIFKYDLGKSYNSYIVENFRPWYRDMDALKEDNIPQNVRVMCHIITACIFDYLASGDFALAKETKNIELNFRRLNYIASLELVQCEVPNWIPQGGFVVGKSFKVWSVVEVKCEGHLHLYSTKGVLESKFICSPKSSISTLTATDKFQWMPFTHPNADPTSLKCIWEDDFENRIKRNMDILVEPSIVPVSGVIPVFVHGPAIHELPYNISCAFMEVAHSLPKKVKGQLVSMNENGKSKVVCTVPFLNTLGRINLDVILDFKKDPSILFSRHVYVVKETDFYASKFSLRKVISDHKELVLLQNNGAQWHELGNVTSFLRITNYDNVMVQSTTQILKLLDKPESVVNLRQLYTFAQKDVEAINCTTHSNISMTIYTPMSIITTLDEINLKLINDSSHSDLFCKHWSKNESPFSPTGYLPCPQTLAQAGVDWRFMNVKQNSIILSPDAISVYIQAVPTSSGSGTQCSYNSNGKQMHGPPSGNRFLRHSPNNRKDYWSYYWNDVLPYMHCCRWSMHKEENCLKYFYPKRSINDRLYRAPNYGAIIGAGHFTIFNGHSFTINGLVGDFWLINYEEIQPHSYSSFKMQARFVPYLETNVTIVTEVAMEEFKNQRKVKVQASVVYTSDHITTLNIKVNEHVLEMSSFVNDFTFYDDGVIVRFNSRQDATLVFSSGFAFNVISDSESSGIPWISVIALTSANTMDYTKGLLFIKNLRKPENFTQIISTSEWAVLNKDSLILGTGGMNNNYTLKLQTWISNITALQATIETFGNLSTLCGNVNECMFDYHVSKSESIAITTRDLQEKLKNYIKSAAETADYCITPQSPENGYILSISGLEAGSTVEIMCDDGYFLQGNESSISNGTFTCNKTDENFDWILESGMSGYEVLNFITCETVAKNFEREKEQYIRPGVADPESSLLKILLIAAAAIIVILVITLILILACVFMKRREDTETNVKVCFANNLIEFAEYSN